MAANQVLPLMMSEPVYMPDPRTVCDNTAGKCTLHNNRWMHNYVTPTVTAPLKALSFPQNGGAVRLLIAAASLEDCRFVGNSAVSGKITQLKMTRLSLRARVPPP